jgi:hypothetical protein
MKATMSAMQITIYGILIAALFSCGGPSIYVSPTGSDKNTGTRKSPVATLQKAVELNRSMKFGMIRIEPGHYYDVSVTLSPQDSGLLITSAKDEPPRLHGGRLFGEWKRNGEWLETEVPDSLWPDLDFRILIINDTLRSRARLPEIGAFFHRSEWPHQWQSSQGGWSQKPTQDDLTTLYYRPEDIGSWLDTRNAELTVFHAWDDSYVALAGIDTINHSLRFSHPATHPAGAYASWAGEKTRQYIVWNIKEGMKRPGQWYVDRTNRKIVYWPMPYEKVDEITAMVPSQHFLVKIEENTQGVKLENLNFSCAGAPIVNTGYGTYNITGAILANKISNLSLKKIRVKNVAGWAAKLTGNHISVTDCEFSFTGAGGLHYAGENIKVERCGIHDLGKLYFGAVGIMGSGNHNLVSHCELYNIPYCAINGVGKRSVSEFNLLYNFKQMMVDGGAIYIYGGDSTIYRGNAVLAKSGNTTEGWTYYFDELSVNCLMENNLAVNTIVPMHHHMAEGVTIRNNLFIDEGHQKLSYPLSSNLSLSGNTFVADEILFSGPNGELGPSPKESFNQVFQKYYETTGIVSFEENRLFSGKVKHDILHVYNRIRTEDFALLTGNGNSLLPRREFQMVIPDAFRKTGYRGNFDDVYNRLMGVKE